MNNQNYIKKAVELADGWGFTEHVVFCIRPEISAPLVCPTWHVLSMNAGKIYLDALAAQLVRQYLKANDCQWLEVNGDPMDTIEYIVDSRMLERIKEPE